MSDDDAHEAGPPDAFLLAHYRRIRRRRKTRLLISAPLGCLSVPAAIVLMFVTGLPWPWIAAGLLATLTALGLLNMTSVRIPERPRPDTELEAAVVVGVEITTWSSAGDQTHTARVIGRPLGSATGQLVHGYREFRSDRGCPVRPGMLFGFRRHPTMRHLVWIEKRQQPLPLLALRDGRPWERADIRDAVVESVHISGEPEPGPEGDWWPTTITVRLDGAPLRDTRPRLPEELGQFEPGTTVRLAREQSVNIDPATQLVTAVLPETF
ncbi:hypothetical protein [Streptomyces sp. NPDC058045]|uniref:hypothetical protein n=1 Tax=Streptomyces sp. NPDC058045 TaxID=3346311 RepID=UPI0036E2250A